MLRDSTGGRLLLDMIEGTGSPLSPVDRAARWINAALTAVLLIACIFKYL